VRGAAVFAAWRPLPLIAIVGVVVASIFCEASRVEARQPSSRMNVLLLLSDDHHYRALGVAGESAVKTPHLNQLAADGVYFSHCFTPMPQCSPSRAAIFSGQDCWTSGVQSGTTRFADDAILWPRLLAEAGYCVFMTGKWHNADMPWDCGFTAGADLKLGGMSDHRRQRLIQWKQSPAAKTLSPEFSSTAFANAFVRFLRDHDERQPFCAFVSFTAPHDPWVPPAPFDAMYDPADLPLPKNFMSQPPFRLPPGFASLRDQQVLPFPRSEHDVRRAMSQYYGMISHLDEQIGRILDALLESPYADNTMVIFAGDHGYSLGSHGFVGKQCMYEEGIHLPLIIRHPTLKRHAATCTDLTSLVDFFPTICEAAGVSTPRSVEGKSLLSLYRGEKASWRSELFASHHSPDKHGMSTQCVRTHRYKLIQHRTTGEEELFDLADDPFELVNLADRAEVSDIRDRLAARLAEWAASHFHPTVSESVPRP
jgi:arylsulfatase A-like enzyme